MLNPGDNVAALIVGFTIQGMALARTLARRGVKVYAFERTKVSACFTSRYVTMLTRETIERDRIVDLLIEIRVAIPERRVVLMPGSDFAVRTLSVRWDELDSLYYLSWHQCREQTRRLTFKTEIEKVARAAGIEHPRMCRIDSEQACSATDGLRFPLILKPDEPPGLFKTRRVDSPGELAAFVRDNPGALPIVAQEIIPGDDDNLFFCTMFLDRGVELAWFTGRKLRSYPPGMGRGTVIEDYDAPEVLALARRYFEGLDLSGPVSIEFKRGPGGVYYLIEPNVGRTEYCVDVVIQGGLDLPYVELLYALGMDASAVASAGPRKPVVWYDTDTEPLCYLISCLKHRSIRPGRKRPAFPYFGHRDPAPLLFAAGLGVRQLARRALGWLGRRARGAMGPFSRRSVSR